MNEQSKNPAEIMHASLKELPQLNDAEAQKKHNQNVNIESRAWREKNFYHR
ncbi:MAG: hypothetical protein ACJZ86_03870 [Pontiellaceae bacterium]